MTYARAPIDRLACGLIAVAGFLAGRNYYAEQVWIYAYGRMVVYLGARPS